MPRSALWVFSAVAIVVTAAAGGWIWHLQSGSPPPADSARSLDGSGGIVTGPPRIELPVPAAPEGPIQFSSLGKLETGIDFVHVSGNSAEKPFPAANGSGAAVLDYDLDGNYDIYFATGTQFPIDPRRAEPTNRIYRSTGDWRFADVTAQSGLGHNGYSAGVAIADFDADGFPDVYVTCCGANRLYHNRGDGTFIQIAETAGTDDEGFAASAAFFDYDNDGLLDLYVCNYGQWTYETNNFCGDRVRNVRLFCSPRTLPPIHGVFYRNEGDETFRDIAAEVGLAERLGRAQGVLAADLDDDGWTDLYIANDLHANSVFLNGGDGRFRDLSEASGAAYDQFGRMQGGMGVDAADARRTGRMDVFVTNFENEHNAYYENLGAGTFQEAADVRGLAAQSLPWVGWGTVFADFDLDGWLDVVVTNGHVDDNLHKLGREARYAQPPLIWRNVEGRFEFLGASAGSYFAGGHPGRGLAAADLDNDGDTDLVIVHQDAAPALLRNERSSPGSVPALSARVRLIGTRGNRDAIGSSLTLSVGPERLVQQIKGGTSYLSAHDLRQVFAVSAAEAELEIRWPGGQLSVVSGIRPGHSYSIVEPVDVAAGPPRVFEDSILPSEAKGPLK